MSILVVSELLDVSIELDLECIGSGLLDLDRSGLSYVNSDRLLSCCAGEVLCTLVCPSLNGVSTCLGELNCPSTGILLGILLVNLLGCEISCNILAVLISDEDGSLIGIHLHTVVETGNRKNVLSVDGEIF